MGEFKQTTQNENYFLTTLLTIIWIIITNKKLMNILFFVPKWYDFGNKLNFEDIISIWFVSHSWISFFSIEIICNWLIYWITMFSILLISWITIDLTQLFFWKLILKNKFHGRNDNKFLYLYFRFIPIIGYFWVLFWTLKYNIWIKKQLSYILIWNIIFLVVNILILQIVSILNLL